MNMVNEDTSRAMHMLLHSTLVLLRTENTGVLDARPEVDMFVIKYTKQSIKIVIILKRYLIIGHLVITTHPNRLCFRTHSPTYTHTYPDEGRNKPKLVDCHYIQVYQQFEVVLGV